MIGAVERRMETGGKMPLHDTFRVGSIMTTAYIMPEGDKSTLPCKGVERVCHRRKSVRSSVLCGWEEGGEWRLAPIVERRAEACHYESEKQAEVSGQSDSLADSL